MKKVEQQAKTILKNLGDYKEDVLFEFAKKQPEFYDGYWTKRTIFEYGIKQLIKDLKTGKDLNEEIRRYVKIAKEKVNSCNFKATLLEIFICLVGLILVLFGLTIAGFVFVCIAIVLILDEIISLII